MATQVTNPYAAVDFSKLMDFAKVDFSDFGKLAEQFKLPGVDGTSLVEAQRKNVEALTAANQVVFEAAQAVTQRQTEILRRVMDDSVKAMQTLATAETPEAKLTKQAEIAKEAYEISIANWREIAEMTSKSNTEAATVINKRVTESLDELKSAFNHKKPTTSKK